MDTIGGSCYSLNFVENKKKIQQEREREDQFQQTLGSCGSLSRYETRTFKNLIPQMVAASVAGLFHVSVGISLAYSAILLPQLKSPDSDLKITDAQGAWIASVITITIPVSGMTCGFLMDSIGRLNTVKLAMAPAVLGWILIALSNSVTMIIIGRIITGFAAAWGTSPAMVYITEIARADMRGSLMSFAPAYTSLGFMMAYLLGYLFHWRTVAWLCNGFAVLPFALLFFIPESPAWLISKERNGLAQKSLDWFHKYQPQPANKAHTFAQLQYDVLVKEHDEKHQQSSQHNSCATKASQFLKPTGYKPLLILMGLFVFQQFSGIYITLFYSIEFFEEVGSNLDPYIASIMIGFVRFFMSIVNTYMLKTFGRRTLMMYGAAAMAACMSVSALYTNWLKEGASTLTWVPIVAILLYVVFSMISLLSIPWTMTAELFPIEIRGLAHSIIYSSAYLIMFFSIQSYQSLKTTFDGVAGVQWFFAGVSVLGLLFAWVLLPEAHGVKLADIQEYFIYNHWYFGSKTKKTNRDKIKQQEQSERLVKNNTIYNA